MTPWVALLLLLAVGASCGTRRWVVEDPALSVLEEYTAESCYPVALSHAQQWQPNAYVTIVFVSLRTDDIENAADRITYGFATPLQGNRQGYAWIYVYPKEGNVEIEAGPVAYTKRPESPLAFESAVVHSLDALRAAEVAGGRLFRESHSDVHVGLSGKWSGDDEMVWVVRYGIGSEPAGFDFWVRAQTGEVLSPRLPKRAWIRCSTDPNLNPDAYPLWKAPGLSQDIAGTLPPCTMVEVIQWNWSGEDQQFWVLVTARMVRAWIARDLLDFERP
jgi:hypothetical protein